jgi:transcriptional regulator with XRE-family HTH domain
MSRIPLNPLGDGLGDYLREQRQSARLSLRQLADLAGISNPYLSQIERGLKRPSAEILQQLAKGLEVSAESLYVRAGILDERQQEPAAAPDTRAVISADPRLSQRQKATLLDVYDSFVGAPEAAPAARGSSRAARTTTAKASRSAKADAPAATTGRATRTSKTAKTATTAKSATTDSPVPNE